MLRYFPIRHIDYSAVKPIADCMKNENVTIIGRVVKASNRRFARVSACVVTLRDRTGSIEIAWYGQPYLIKTYTEGTWLSVSGKVGSYQSRLQISSPDTEIVDAPKDGENIDGKIIPIYSISREGENIIPQRTLRSAMEKCVRRSFNKIEEYLPEDILTETHMLGINDAIQNLHFPQNQDHLRLAKQRFLFESMLFNQLFMQSRRRRRERDSNQIEIDVDNVFIEDMKSHFPFSLTNDQENAIKEIIEDLQRKVPMRRMLQGEVGSGKTLVALVSLFSVIRSGYQGAFMSPTEILAQQHYINVKNQFRGTNFLDFSNNVISVEMPGIMQRRIGVALLLGSHPLSEKKLIQKLINNGEIDLIIGTHSLFQENFKPPRMGFSVVDEQHRFGVEQRDSLVNKSKVPHLLSMSATPIPRSLALTLFGDLDISTLKDIPSGRKGIETTWCKNKEDKDTAYRKVIEEINAGRQAFIVCPLIHKSEKLNHISVEEKMTELLSTELSKFSIEILHGEMSMEKKSDVMNRFKKNEFNILLATPVIEVGVDIPNATCMIIESSDRFGLSGLHQIRGRVGRGSEKSFCYLFSNNISEEARERLNAFENSKDGFDLSETDLKIRGPGDYVGSKQSGVSGMSYEMINDTETLELSRLWALKILGDNKYSNPEYNKLRLEFEDRFAPFDTGLS